MWNMFTLNRVPRSRVLILALVIDFKSAYQRCNIVGCNVWTMSHAFVLFITIRFAFQGMAINELRDRNYTRCLPTPTNWYGSLGAFQVLSLFNPINLLQPIYYHWKRGRHFGLFTVDRRRRRAAHGLGYVAECIRVGMHSFGNVHLDLHSALPHENVHLRMADGSIRSWASQSRLYRSVCRYFYSIR